MADENTSASTNVDEDSEAKVTSFETSTTYPEAVGVYNNARVNSTGEIVGGDQLSFFEKVKNFFKTNWLTMLVTFVITFVIAGSLGSGIGSGRTGGLSSWKK